MNIIDLTLTYHAGMRGVEIEPSKSLEKDGWNATTLHLYSHAGTHMDAPWHFGAGDLTIDRLPLERCIGPCRMADLTPIGAGYEIKIQDLGAEANLVNEGDSLILKTGWSRYIGTEKYRHALPRISESLALWCVKKKIKVLGVEPPSVADVNNIEEVTKIHQILLEGNITIVEGLTNLQAITAKEFILMVLPLKIKDGDGAPARAIAIENSHFDL